MNRRRSPTTPTTPCSMAGSRRASIGDGAIAAATVSRSATTRPTRSPAPPRCPPAVPEAVFDELLQAVGDRKLLARPHIVPASKQRECDLLGEEGVPARHLVDAQERGPREPSPVSRMTRSMSSRDSGPTWTTCTRSCGNAGTTPRGSTSPSDPRTAVSTPTGSSFRRRTTNCNTRADGRSIHCASSMARTTGVVDATARKHPRTAREMARWSARPPVRAFAGVPPPGPLAAARGATPGSRPGRVRRGRRGPRTTDASRPRRDCTRASDSRARGLPPAPPPHRGLPDARISGQQRGGRAVRDRIEGTLDRRELELPSDDVAGQRPSPRWWTSGF